MRRVALIFQASILAVTDAEILESSAFFCCLADVGRRVELSHVDLDFSTDFQVMFLATPGWGKEVLPKLMNFDHAFESKGLLVTASGVSLSSDAQCCLADFGMCLITELRNVGWLN